MTNDGLRKKFTGYERDDETGLDYAQARYYSSKQGRFTSPDEFTGGPDELYDFADDVSEKPMLYAELTDPQSFNKYQYCYNNPLSLIDPDGHKTWAEWARIGLEVATYIPGPIGTVASAVQAVDKLVQGDYAGAASSALGAVPGAKLVRAGAKAIDKISDGARLLDKANDLRKEFKAVTQSKPPTSFVVTPKGTAVPVSQSRMREGFDKAGFPKKDANSPSGEKGVIHTVPTKSGKPIDVRTMEGSSHHQKLLSLIHLEQVAQEIQMVGRQKEQRNRFEKKVIYHRPHE